MLMGFAAGVTIANQSPVNAYLKKFVGSPFRASLISFTIGTVFIGILTVATGSRLLPTMAMITGNPWWLWLGGLLGLIYLTTNILLFPKLGAVQTVILPILGQVLMGTAIDTFGLFGAAHIPLTTCRLIGVFLLLLGIFVAVVLVSMTKESLSIDKTIKQKENSLNLWRVWAVVAGALSPVQQAINGRLGIVMSAPYSATFISFLTGAILLLFLVLITEHRIIESWDFIHVTPWWGFLGGIMGVGFVLATVIGVPIVGAGLMVTTALIGQVVGSILVQQFGWWRSMKISVKPLQLIGIMIMVVGVVFIKFM
jgi:transporter family-2 protein